MIDSENKKNQIRNNENKLAQAKVDYDDACVKYEDFKESMLKSAKEIDPEKEKSRLNAQDLADKIVTVSRVEKMLTKLRDEGILSSNITPNDMKTVAKQPSPLQSVRLR